MAPLVQFSAESSSTACFVAAEEAEASVVVASAGAASVEGAEAASEAAAAVDARAAGGSRRVLAAVACVSILVGCAAAPETPDDNAHGLEASASRTRDDDNAGGQFQTRLANTGDSVLSVVSVALDSPGFEPAAASSRAVELGPGNRIDIPTEYGRVRCGQAPTPARATVVLAGGTAVSVPLTTPYDVLDTIAHQECTAEDVQRSVALTLTPGIDVGSDSLPAELVIDRVDTDVTVRLDEVRGSVLYGLTSALPATMPADSESLVVPVEITAATCSAHAIADSKKPFVFPVFLAFGDAEAVYARIPVPTVAQEMLIAFQKRVCGGNP